jgi:hypothetical protein
MNRLLSLALAASIALSSASSAFAKAKPSKTTLADFKGNYTGTVILGVSGLSYSGPVSLSFKSNKAGKTGSIAVSGSISGMGSTLPISANITLAKGSLTIDNFVFNTIAQGSYPGFATYKVGKSAITYTGSATVSPEVYPFSGSIQSKTKGRTQTLTYTALINLSGTVFPFTFTVSRKLSKSELAD